MVQKKKLSKYLIVSCLFHIFVALAMARIYAEQPRRHSRLQIMGSVRIQYKEPEPPPKPKPKLVTEVQPEKKVVPKKEEPKVIPQKVEPPKVTQRRRRMNAPAPGVALERSPQRSRTAPGVAGVKGTRGPTGDLPGMSASGGISDPKLTIKTGGSGLSPGLTHGSMKMPTGPGYLPGAGGKGIAGFKTGVSQSGTGIGRVDIPGTGGSDGRSVEGPGKGISNIAGRTKTGSGRGTTGLDVGIVSGMGEVDSEPTGGKPGGGGGGPGTGGHHIVESRTGPSLTSRAGADNKGDKALPATDKLPEEDHSGKIGKKEFKADLERDMTSTTQVFDEPTSRKFGDALQSEINKNLYSLRKMYEDWQNLKIPNVPKTLRITIELGMEKGKTKLLKIDFHNANLSPRIKNDLTKKIRDWEFKSLYDGKDDPEKWPVKMIGKISWQ